MPIFRYPKLNFVANEKKLENIPRNTGVVVYIKVIKTCSISPIAILCAVHYCKVYNSIWICFIGKRLQPYFDCFCFLFLILIFYDSA